MIALRFLHKWIGVFLGVQLILWMLSGFIMNWYDHGVVEGNHLRNRAANPVVPLPAFTDSAAILSRLEGGDPVRSVTARLFRGQPVLEVRAGRETLLFNAVSGERILIDETLAQAIAEADFSGDGKVVDVSRITAPTMETRESVGPGWRVDFDNDENSSLYLSAETGRIWERRHDTWRLFDIFWMLHIMDYQERKDFNNWIVILSAWVVLWLVLSGFIMLIENLRNGDFNLVRGWKSRTRFKRVTICDSDGSHIEQLSVTGDRSLFDVLAAEDIHLPSSCGGGGSCGLCRVRMIPAPAPTPADLREVPQVEIDEGYRLSCQHRDFDGKTIQLPHGLLDAADLEMTVVSSRFVTPYICELRLRANAGEAIRFDPGSYMQVTIPPYRKTIADLAVPDELKAAWRTATDVDTVGTDEELRRTYSLACRPGEFGSGEFGSGEFDPEEGATDIILNVKVALPIERGHGHPVGTGSAYMASLSAGDKVQVRGPFGDFALKDTGCEKVFIGGGAGMAPLRSMILHLLHEGHQEQLSFWYGARTEAELYYREDFEGLKATAKNFDFHVVLSELDARSDWEGYRGFVHQVAFEQYLQQHPAIETCEFYLCGPPPMLKATLDMLTRLGVSDDKIAFDDFGI